MSTTGIQRVYVTSGDHYMFVKLEDSRNNRYLEENKDVGDCHVPWCSSTADLLKKAIIVINRTKATLVGFIWQDKDKDGDDRVRFAKHGWEKAAPGNRIAGFSNVGTKINLKIDANDNVSAEQASPD